MAVGNQRLAHNTGDCCPLTSKEITFPRTIATDDDICVRTKGLNDCLLLVTISVRQILLVQAPDGLPFEALYDNLLDKHLANLPPLVENETFFTNPSHLSCVSIYEAERRC